ncbi:VOC family protein [Corynebacterium uterequi]|uniref:Lactoylglutathione lyase family protein n=1 Tax=Corynebacterium uterequi TaxID=1072256 RepID=A0A0G3HBN2_9CORY|nr:VOC family protein [Corynebacterium uterequi]AKK10105.1 lactoylglutathione lyase family protein [Corynebacterium uterequi]
MPAFQALDGMPYWVELHTSQLGKARYFYQQLLGWTITAEPGGNLIARKEGLPVAGIVPGAASNTWVTYFLADDLDQSVRDVATAGGRVLSDPTPTSLGRIAVAADATGGLFGLIEPEGDERFVAAGEPGTAVWHDYSSTSNYTAAVAFYEELFDWATATFTEGDYSYTTALADGAAFAGLRDAHALFPSEVPSFWQSFLGVADVAECCRRAVELGGDVIRAPFDAEFGRLAIIADPAGATFTVCEVAPPVDEAELRESDDLFSL